MLDFWLVGSNPINRKKSGRLLSPHISQVVAHPFQNIRPQTAAGAARSKHSKMISSDEESGRKNNSSTLLPISLPSIIITYFCRYSYDVTTYYRGSSRYMVEKMSLLIDAASSSGAPLNRIELFHSGWWCNPTRVVFFFSLLKKIIFPPEQGLKP